MGYSRADRSSARDKRLGFVEDETAQHTSARLRAFSRRRCPRCAIIHNLAELARASSAFQERPSPRCKRSLREAPADAAVVTLLARQKDNPLRGRYLRVLTVFVTDHGENDRSLDQCFALDALGADFPICGALSGSWSQTLSPPGSESFAQPQGVGGCAREALKSLLIDGVN